MFAIINLDGGIHRGEFPGIWMVEKRRAGFDTSCSIFSEKVLSGHYSRLGASHHLIDGKWQDNA